MQSKNLPILTWSFLLLCIGSMAIAQPLDMEKLKALKPAISARPV